MAVSAKTESAELEKGRGRDADEPSEIPLAGWWDIGWCVWQEVGEDRVLLIAAGATFYLLLALFPALAAFVSLYGFVADPVTVADHVSHLGGLLPSAGVDIIRSQLQALASQNQRALGIGLLTGLAIALWSANGRCSLLSVSIFGTAWATRCFRPQCGGRLCRGTISFASTRQVSFPIPREWILRTSLPHLPRQWWRQGKSCGRILKPAAKRSSEPFCW
jgi:hypothetical protein